MGLKELTLPKFLINFLSSFQVVRPHFSEFWAPLTHHSCWVEPFLTLGFGLLNSSAQPAFGLLCLDFLVLLVNWNTHISCRGQSWLGKSLKPPKFHSDRWQPCGHRSWVSHAAGQRGRLRRFLIPPKFPFLGSRVAVLGCVGCVSSQRVKPKPSWQKSCSLKHPSKNLHCWRLKLLITQSWLALGHSRGAGSDHG